MISLIVAIVFLVIVAIGIALFMLGFITIDEYKIHILNKKNK